MMIRKINNLNYWNMDKRIIFILMGILLFGHAFSQKKPSILIKSPLIKKIEFKDTLSKNDKAIYHQCQEWKLTCKEVHEIFSLAKPISSEEKEGLYNWLPCYFTSEVLYNGSAYTMEINAASFIVLYNKKRTLYFGCSSRDCSKFFVLSGGNASADWILR